MSHALQERHLTDIGKWKLSKISLIPALIILVGMTALCWPFAAQWVNQYYQSEITANYSNLVANAIPASREQLRRAHEYNDALKVGAIYEANTNAPSQSEAEEGGEFNYWEELKVDNSGLMARLRIPKIKLDLPVYHGTSEETLYKGLGHLRGTSLPVGGKGTRALITGHRGLAEAEMFTRLDEITRGDTFTIEVFGETLTYKVVEKIVVDPDEKQAFKAVPGRDLVTLVTCTPLGINSHRILVTGERIIPTPKADLDRAGQAPDVPGFPWWLVLYILGLCLLGYYIYWSGKPVPKKKGGKRAAKKESKKVAKRARKRGKVKVAAGAREEESGADDASAGESVRPEGNTPEA